MRDIILSLGAATLCAAVLQIVDARSHPAPPPPDHSVAHLLPPEPGVPPPLPPAR